MDVSVKNNKILAQLRPANTSTATAVTPLGKGLDIVYTLIIANTTGTAANASVYYDEDGTTYDQSTALLYAVPVPANDSTVLYFKGGIPLEQGANIGIQSGTSNALTFTFFGIRLLNQG